ncbi:MAG: hypothetical protein COS95_09490 [Ignavibacteriales bacterium CG07_land_8_20_14_0_80_59_12]|nr:MAG: hypothetical protein COS95_09490 [Ignavibacteriales bacterium CG07_land_8_20_14_0_80_59_12]
MSNPSRWGKPLPSLKLVATDGRQSSISDYKGSKLVLMFFKVECPHCQRTLGIFKSLCEYYSTQHFKMIAISLSSPEETSKFTSENAFPFPIVLASYDKVKREYGISALPAVFFVNESMVVIHRVFGEMSAANWKSIFDDSLSEKPQEQRK